MRAVAICIFVLAAGAGGAQEDGARLFRVHCSLCHGGDGNLVPGVPLGHTQFRHAATDEELVKIVREGIPDTAMPPTVLTEPQARGVVAYLHALAAEPVGAGDPARGKALFEGKGNCRSCHRVQGEGARLGPDLTEIGSNRSPEDLARSILYPDAEIARENRMFRAVTKTGTIVSGRLLNQDSFTVQLLDTQEHLRSFVKSDLREWGIVDQSPMPSYRGKLDAQEVADLVTYLGLLKALERPGAAGRGRGGN
jgi:putative heme-binding domain-containing protein